MKVSPQEPLDGHALDPILARETRSSDYRDARVPVLSFPTIHLGGGAIDLEDRAEHACTQKPGIAKGNQERERMKKVTEAN